MQARRAARELTLILLSQLDKKIVNYSSQDFEDIILKSVRILSNNALEELKLTTRSLVEMKDAIDTYEAEHETNLSRPIGAKNKPVPLPLTSDMSKNIENMLEIAEKFKPSKVVYLDHHATSKDDMNKWHEMAKNHLIPGKPECFTQNINTECGASLTLKHVRYRCHELRQNHNIEYVVSLCKDYDLWIQKYKNSMPFVTGISADMPHPEVWRKVLTSEKLWQKYAAMGTGILKQQIALAKQILRNPENMEIKTINGCKVLVLNLNPQWVNLVSHTIVENSDIDAVISYSINGLKNVAVSIRSAERCDMHCGEFMKKYFAGGGHKHAAGGRSASFNEFCKTLGYAEKPAVDTERNRTLEL